MLHKPQLDAIPSSALQVERGSLPILPVQSVRYLAAVAAADLTTHTGRELISFGRGSRPHYGREGRTSQMTATVLRFLFAKCDWRGDTAILVQLYCRSDQMLLGAGLGGLCVTICSPPQIFYSIYFVYFDKPHPMKRSRPSKRLFFLCSMFGKPNWRTDNLFRYPWFARDSTGPPASDCIIQWEIKSGTQSRQACRNYRYR